MRIGTPYAEMVKITGAGYPVMRCGRWLIAEPVILDRKDLLTMLKALEGMAPGDFDGELGDEHSTSNVQRPTSNGRGGAEKMETR